MDPVSMANLGIAAAKVGMTVAELIGQHRTKNAYTKQQQQKILDNLVAAGYKVQGQLPRGLKMPRGAQQVSGTQASTNPEYNIWFHDDGTPVLHVRKPGSVQQPIQGGLGYEAPVNEQAVEQLNNQFGTSYTGGITDPNVLQNIQQANSPQRAVFDKYNKMTQDITDLGPAIFSRLAATPANFDPIADLARKNYARYAEPALKESFFPGSGAYKNALGIGRGELESQLAVQGSQYDMQQRNQDMQLLNLLANYATNNPVAMGPQGTGGFDYQTGIPLAPGQQEQNQLYRQGQRKEQVGELVGSIKDLIGGLYSGFKGANQEPEEKSVMGGTSTAQSQQQVPYTKTQFAKQFAKGAGKELGNIALTKGVDYLLKRAGGF